MAWTQKQNEKYTRNTIVYEHEPTNKSAMNKKCVIYLPSQLSTLSYTIKYVWRERRRKVLRETINLLEL